MYSWYILQFKSNSQELARRNLSRQGFDVFLPQEKVTQRHSNNFRRTYRPLFPGYMFVSLDPDLALWRKVNSTLGVSKLVSFSGAPKPVPNSLIETLKNNCDVDGRLLINTSVKVGDNVKIKDGPFHDFITKIESYAPDERVWVLLNLMGRQTRVKLSKHQFAAH